MQGGGRRRVEVGHGVTLTPWVGLCPGEGAWLARLHLAVPWGRAGVASIAGRASFGWGGLNRRPGSMWPVWRAVPCLARARGSEGGRGVRWGKGAGIPDGFHPFGVRHGALGTLPARPQIESSRVWSA
ncbi:hypothetical protein GCM10010295_38650 [Streptomyces intermedius]